MPFIGFGLAFLVLTGLIWWLGAIFFWLYILLLPLFALGCYVYEKSR